MKKRTLVNIVVAAAIFIPAAAFSASNQIVIYRKGGGIDFKHINNVAATAKRTAPAKALGSVCDARNCPSGMCYVRPGSFLMGTPLAGKDRFGDEAFHAVRISEGFCMAKYEVTQSEWRKVMGNNPSYNRQCGPDCPVERVSWFDVQKFIKKINARYGGGYRLPTEAEWEYSARATAARASYTNNDSLLEPRRGEDWRADDETCRTRDCSGALHPSGRAVPNFWGLYDMLSNVQEWTADWYNRYPAKNQINPKGPSAGVYKAVRGGCLNTMYPALCGAGTRDFFSPKKKSRFIGFRLVRKPMNAHRTKHRRGHK